MYYTYIYRSFFCRFLLKNLYFIFSFLYAFFFEIYSRIFLSFYSPVIACQYKLILRKLSLHKARIKTCETSVKYFNKCIEACFVKWRIYNKVSRSGKFTLNQLLPLLLGELVHCIVLEDFYRQNMFINLPFRHTLNISVTSLSGFIVVGCYCFSLFPIFL